VLDIGVIKTVIFSLLCGVAFGASFSFAKLPLPAPPTFSGIVGIFGVYLGFKLYSWLSGAL
jgi:XapX domain-containing protein